MTLIDRHALANMLGLDAELRAACKEAGVSVVAARRGIARSQRARAGSDDPT